MDIYNNKELTVQSIYDSFNNLMFSNDKRIFTKMIIKTLLFTEVKESVGDIVEFGVFKGASIALLLKLKDMYEPHSIMKVIGFDYFDSDNLLSSLEGVNKKMMNDVIKRVDENEITFETVKKRLEIFNDRDYLLLKGEAVTTCKKYYNDNIGARIKLLYMDLDLGEPTYKILKELWDRVVIGGIIVFDEYAYHKWDESQGVDMFLKEIDNDKYILYNTKISAPTMYLKKVKL